MPPDPSADQPTYVQDPAELDRLAARAVKSTMRFRQWVKQKCDLSDEQLDGLVRDAADKVWQGISCLDCGKCCHAQNITVDKDDIERLAAHLGMTKPAFRGRYVRIVDGEPGIEGAPCRFLADTTCTVYEARPKACRDFPFLHSAGFRTRILYLSGLAHVCPIVYATLENLKRTLPWRK